MVIRLTGITKKKMKKTIANDIVIELVKDFKHQQDMVQSAEGICRTIPAGTHGSTPHLLKTLVKEKSNGKTD